MHSTDYQEHDTGINVIPITHPLLYGTLHEYHEYTWSQNENNPNFILTRNYLTWEDTRLTN